MDQAVYFVTWRVHPKQPELSPAERDLLVSVLSFFDGSRYNLLAYVVMDDHVHVLVEPFTGEHLQQIIQSWKSFTANKMQREDGRRGAVWQDEYFDRIMRDEAEFLEKAEYIFNNPIKKWPELLNYRWLGWKMMD